MGRFNVSSPLGNSWERIMSLTLWVAHGTTLRNLHSHKMLVESRRSIEEPYSWEDFMYLGKPHDTIIM